MQRWIATSSGLDTESQPAISLDGRFFPSPSLFEDDYGVRTVVFAYTSTPVVPVAIWARLFAESPSVVVFTTDSRTWRATTIADWMDERTENRVAGLYEIAERKLRSFDHFPSYVEVVEAHVQPEAVDTNPGLVHLHAHSEFSALDGYSHVSEMVEQAVLHGQGALALTDHGVCAGHPALQAEAAKAGIKPIFGIESYFVDDRLFRPMSKPVSKSFVDDLEYRRAMALWEEEQKRGRDYWHLVLWAMNDEGLRNLWAMSSEAHKEGFYRKPRMDWDTLERHSSGVMVSTACLRGPLSAALLNEDDQMARQRLGRLMGIFDGRVHMEIHTNRLPEQQTLNTRLVTMAQEYGLPVVAVSDSHYPSAEHKFCHKVWIAAQTDSDLQDDADLFAGNEDYHILSEAEARAALDYLPASVVDEAIHNTYLVAERCDATIRTRGSLPVFSKRPTREESVHRDVERLVEICMSNWHKTLGKAYANGSPIPQEVYEARFEREMKLLISKGFCGYFLMVADYCRHSRANGVLVGPGRGSGGGCLVAYLANITEIDPVEAGLIFERFLTEGRTALPDFDVDFPSSFRDWLTNYIISHYGEDHVVRVGNHIYMRKKKAVRTLAKVLASTIDIHYPDIDLICKVIDQGDADSAGLGHSWEEVWAMFPDEYAHWTKKYPLLMQMCEAIVGRLATYGRHAAGVVISPDTPLTGEIPLRYGEDGHAIAEWNMDALDALGLVKFDLLTIRNLDTLQMGVDLDKSLTLGQAESMVANEGIDFYSWREEYNDPEVWDEICAGRTLGMFQIETYAGTAMCKRHQPRSIAELADVITLVRPGPMRSGLTDTYLRRRHGEEAVSFPHPLLEQTLATTYGCILYQEDVMNVCMVLAGYDENQADGVRKILGKKKVEEAKKAGEKFVLACDANGIERSVSEPLWAQMEEFAKYSFNRAHAYGYAIIAYWCAWLKVRRPLAFTAAILSTVDAERVPDFIEEARQRGFTPLGPDINASDRRFAVVQVTEGVPR